MLRTLRDATRGVRWWTYRIDDVLHCGWNHPASSRTVFAGSAHAGRDSKATCGSSRAEAHVSRVGRRRARQHLTPDMRMRLAHVLLHDGFRLLEYTKLSWDTIARAIAGSALYGDTIERIELACGWFPGTSVEQTVGIRGE